MAGVQSIERAFSLLRSLASRPGGVTELANRVDLPKSTVARLLAALEAEGAVERDDDGTLYQIGQGFIDLFAAERSRTLIATARPFLVGLSLDIGESSGLDVLDNGWVHFVDQVEADNDVQVRDWTGESGRAHSLPGGVVVLAHYGDDRVDDYIASGLEAVTPNTVTDPDDLRARLAQVRSAGYAWGFEEFAEGINSVAAPVFDSDGVVAALRVHGPTYRFPDPNRTHDIGLLVTDAARRLSEQLHRLTSAP